MVRLPTCHHSRLWIVALVPLICGCETPSPAPGGSRLPMVRVTQPVQKQVQEYCYFTGRTEAAETVDLQARVTGFLEAVEFKPGDSVTAGTTLFRIDPRPYQAKLDIANAQIALAEAQQRLAEADFRRAQETARTPGVITQAELDKYQAALREAIARIDASRANAEAAKLDVDFTNVTAPFDGIVGRNYPSLGSLVRQDDTLLATIVSQDPIYAYFEADEMTMLRVGRLMHEGKIEGHRGGGAMSIEMSLADEADAYPHRGTIDFNNNRVSPTTGTMEVRGVFENPQLGDGRNRLFVAGMFVRVRVPLGKPTERILVPEAAIGTDQGRKFVLVVNEKNIVEERIVQLGPQQPGGLQAVDPVMAEGGESAGTTVPLTPDDRVIIGGLQLVRPGTEVKIRNAASGEKD